MVKISVSKLHSAMGKVCLAFNYNSKHLLEDVVCVLVWGKDAGTIE